MAEWQSGPALPPYPRHSPLRPPPVPVRRPSGQPRSGQPRSVHSAPGPPGPGREHCELYSPGALFSWPELQAMAADGVLTQLYQRGYLPPGVPASPQLRARAASLAVAPAIRQRVVAGRMTAAWIYGCAAEPDRLGAARGHQPAHFQPEVRARLHLPRSPARAVRRRQHGRADGVQPAADGPGRRPARGGGTGRAGPAGAVGPSRTGRAAPAAPAGRRRQPAPPAQAGGAGEAGRHQAAAG